MKQTPTKTKARRTTLALRSIDRALRGHVKTLLTDGSVADRMFLLQVLEQLASDGHGEELNIASAFETCIRNRRCVVLGASEYEGMQANTRKVLTRKVLEMPLASISTQ